MKQFLKETSLWVVHRAIRQFIKPEKITQNPYVAGKVFPMQEEGEYFILEKPNVPNTSDAVSRMPASRELRMGYGEDTKDFLDSGRRDVKAMLDILEQAGQNSETLAKVLELGCATGRMLRFYPYHQDKSELWGVDVVSKNIAWCQQNLPSYLQFATTTTAPHLPFEDNSFDLVYCGSVFTHVSDLADAWFLELRRVLRKGGFMYITIHDRNSVKILLEEYDKTFFLVQKIQEMDAETAVLSKDYASFSMNSDPYSQVFYDAEYIINKWSSYAKFISKTEAAYCYYQTALVFQKPL